MLSDIISQNKTYNVKLAQLFGLENAVYINAVLEQLSESKNQQIKLNPKKIQEITTLTPGRQKQIQEELEINGIIVSIDDKIGIDFGKLYSCFSLSKEQEKELSNNRKTINKVQKEIDKKSVYLSGLKKCITHTTDEIDALYEDLIACILDKFGYMNGAQVRQIQSQLNDYTKNDLTKIKELLIISITNSYRDMSWAIKKYESSPNFKAETEVVVKEEAKIAKDIVF